MTSIDDRDIFNLARWSERGRRARLPLAVAAVVFAALWVTGTLPAMPALAGFGVIALAIMAAVTAIETPRVTTASIERQASNVPAIDAVLAALPDPVVALTRNGDVLA